MVAEARRPAQALRRGSSGPEEVHIILTEGDDPTALAETGTSPPRCRPNGPWTAHDAAPTL